MGSLTYKTIVRNYTFNMENSKDEKITLILCYVPTYLVLYCRYGIKYAVSMLSKVRECLRSVEDF